MTSANGRLPAIILAAALAVTAAEASRSGADPPSGPGSLEGWSSLTLGAEKALIFSARATLDVSEAAYPRTGKAAIVFKTRSRARILGATGFQEETTSYIDRADHRPLEFFQLRPGDSARRSVFLEGLVRQTRWEPPASRPDSEFSEWREVETIERHLTYIDGSGPKAGEAPTDPYALIYLLRDMDLTSRRAPREFTTLYRRHLMRVRAIPGERRRNERRAVNEVTGAPENLKLRERRIRIRPVGEGASSFRGLMGMRGDMEIWLDEATGALVEIDGDAPGLGRMQVLLTSFRRQARAGPAAR